MIEVKRLSQELADRWGAALTTVFVVLGLFSIATGTMLVVLIFVMLAAERRTELGVLRALGARQGRVAATLLYEGLFYDLVAAAVGVRSGVGGGGRADLDERGRAERLRDRADAAASSRSAWCWRTAWARSSRW